MPALLRWLLPIVAMFALLGTSVTSFAAAGVIGESECCCPDPDTCKCHDHDGHPEDDTELKRCGGEAQLVTPSLVVAMLVEHAETATTMTVAMVEYVAAPEPPERPERPETPPF